MDTYEKDCQEARLFLLRPALRVSMDQGQAPMRARSTG